MNLAETGQSKLKREKKVWLSQPLTADVIEFTFQQEKYEKFLKNSEEIMGRGPTQRQCTQRERAEKRRYVEQVCDVILNGDLLEEREEEQPDFVPSKKVKHHLPNNLDKGPEERPKKETGK